MTADSPGAAPRIAVVGGGLAGLAAAAALCGRGYEITLVEARRQLGGRAASFRDSVSGELVDHCQHVSMGCCTNLADFCRRVGVAGEFRRDRRLHFFGPDGRQYDFAATPWLPAPLHLAPAFLRLGYLSWGDKLGIARAMLKLARAYAPDDERQPTIGQWLRQQGQSERAIERFWSVVLVSALGEEIDRASLAAARQVFVDGFMANAEAYEVLVPQVPLGDLFGRRLESWLEHQGVKLSLGTAVEQVVVESVPAPDHSSPDGSSSGGLPRPQYSGDPGGSPHETENIVAAPARIAEQAATGALRVAGLALADGSHHECDAVIVALPWRRVREIFTETTLAALPHLAQLDKIAAAPISGVHLWFDREITPLPHAVLVGKQSQWLFNRGRAASGEKGAPIGRHYQVVISASRPLAGRDREQVIREIVAELASIWPAAGEAELLHARLVTEQTAVFSLSPGMEQLRPPQQTPIANLALAGDWTRTGWPATMEGAVRSGYLAAEAVLQGFGQKECLLAPDLPRGWLARRLL